MLKKISSKIGYFAFAFALFAMAGINKVLAAADTDLQNVLGTTSPGYLTDNKSTLLTWVGVVFGFVIVIGIVKAALSYGRRQALGAIGGGKKRR